MNMIPLNMIPFRALDFCFNVKEMDTDIEVVPSPLILNQDGDKTVYSVSPLHGRSFVVGRRNDGRYIVTKGNGLCYSEYVFMHTPEMPTDVWGLLLMEDALRDYYCNRDVQPLGIKTNKMECVLEIDYPVYIPQTNRAIKPAILQYNVECPYRISDACFMERSQIETEVAKWQQYNTKGYSKNHEIAADVLIGNLRKLHDNNILHNALNEQNYTWALELLDFELTRTPQHPYTKADYERHVPTLYSREVIQTYVIINYIAGVLREQIDFAAIDRIWNEYGFDIEQYHIASMK